MKDYKEKNELPSWHRKSQKAYRLNRIVIVLQMVAALVLAGLIAEGRTKVENAHFIERGYEDIVRDLRKLGAKITSET